MDVGALEAAEEEVDGGAGEADWDIAGPVTMMFGLLLLAFGSNRSEGNGTGTMERTVSQL